MSCVTLLSDFGLQDASVASAKGILMQHLPGVPQVDISHLVEPFQLQQAAYLLQSAYRNFPAGTCHLLLFDIFSEAHPRLLLCSHAGQYFFAPDNGLLSLAFPCQPEQVWVCYEMDKNGFLGDWIHAAGRMMAQLAQQPPEGLGLKPCELKVAPKHWRPNVIGDIIECHVIHIDRYENVVVNLTREMFEEHGRGRPFRIRFMRDEELTQVSNHFYSVREGQQMCRFNSAGFLEIGISKGKAASLFGLKMVREKHVMYNTIKIFFGDAAPSRTIALTR